MGLCTGWALRRAGWDVEILEQDDVPNPRGSSVDRHRLIRHAYGSQAGYMKMVDAAFDAWQVLWGDLGEVLYRPTGILAFSSEPSGWVGQSMETLAADGRPFAALDGAAIAARFPLLSVPGSAVGLLTQEGGLLFADRIVGALAGRLAGCIRRMRVVEVDAERRRLLGADGTWRSGDLLVLAAGPWGPAMLGSLRGRVTPSRQTVAYFAPPAAVVQAWVAMPAMINLSAEGGFWAFPPVDGIGLKAGDHSFTLGGDPDGPRGVAAEEIHVIEQLCRAHLVGFDRFTFLEAKDCYYDVEPNEEFVIEQITAGVWVMSGFSGHGFKFGACIGLAIARAVEEKAAADALPNWARGALV
jgi:sarcosine oxidase subunit beta